MQVYNIFCKGKKLKLAISTALELWENNKLKQEIYKT